MKRIQDAMIGDTFTTVGDEDKVEMYPGFEEPKPMVFVAAFPTDQSDYTKLADSIGQLVLNDRSVTLQKDFSEALGAGWRLGFLGSLHCSVFQDRLRQEHGADIIITEPAVPTRIVWSNDGKETIITNPADFPDNENVRLRKATIYEPFVLATITLPDEYLGRVIELCENARGLQKSIEFFHATQVILKYEVPMASLVDDLFGKLKGATKGYATLDYEDAGWRESHLVKLNLLVNKKAVDAIARVVHASQVERLGRQWVTKFKEHVERQMFGMFTLLHIFLFFQVQVLRAVRLTNSLQKSSSKPPRASASSRARPSSPSARTCLPSCTPATSRAAGSCSTSRRPGGSG
jgi:elongation factor 4